MEKIIALIAITVLTIVLLINSVIPTTDEAKKVGDKTLDTLKNINTNIVP